MNAAEKAKNDALAEAEKIANEAHAQTDKV